MGIYVEIFIRGSLDDLWEKTQTPQLHQRWDVRFTDITYLPGTQPQRFLYATRIGFGLRISGEGETVAIREGDDGQRTSSLKFWSNDPKSLIREGSGYWKYIPQTDGARFLTWYNYDTRFGWPGRLFDRVIFRPLLGWATAWSFDRLCLWIEKGIDPGISLQRSFIYSIARLAVAFIWLYHGIVPKLLYHHPDELLPLLQGGLSNETALSVVNLAGVLEVILGLAMFIWWRSRGLFLLTIALMVFAFVTVALTAPTLLVAAFNPVSLNLSMSALSAIGYLAGVDLPSASNCLRKPAEQNS